MLPNSPLVKIYVTIKINSNFSISDFNFFTIDHSINFFSVLNWIKKLKANYKKNPLFNPSLEESFRKFNRIGKITSGWLASLHNAKKDYIEYEIPGK